MGHGMRHGRIYSEINKKLLNERQEIFLLEGSIANYKAFSDTIKRYISANGEYNHSLTIPPKERERLKQYIIKCKQYMLKAITIMLPGLIILASPSINPIFGRHNMWRQPAYGNKLKTILDAVCKLTSTPECKISNEDYSQIIAIALKSAMLNNEAGKHVINILMNKKIDSGFATTLPESILTEILDEQTPSEPAIGSDQAGSQHVVADCDVANLLWDLWSHPETKLYAAIKIIIERRTTATLQQYEDNDTFLHRVIEETGSQNSLKIIVYKLRISRCIPNFLQIYSEHLEQAAYVKGKANKTILHLIFENRLANEVIPTIQLIQKTLQEAISRREDLSKTPLSPGQDISGDTVLHLALTNRQHITATDAGIIVPWYKQIVENIMAAYPDEVNLKNKDGNTPLHLAAMFNTTDRLKIIITPVTRGCIYLKNNDGKTPLELFLDRKQTNPSQAPEIARALVGQNKDLLKIVYLHFGGKRSPANEIFDEATDYNDAISRLQQRQENKKHRAAKFFNINKNCASFKTLNFIGVGALPNQTLTTTPLERILPGEIL